jgi:chromosome partitioning protein
MITSLISMKGGTAKTTTAVNLAAYLALSGKKVLLIDLDPQSFATISMGLGNGHRGHSKATAADVLMEGSQISEATYPSHVTNLDLVPSDRRLASADVLLADTAGRERILKDKLTRVQAHYDHILIDNPPSLSLVSINSLVASDHYIITVTPSFLSQVGLNSLLETVDVLKKNMNAKVELLGILVTMVDLRMKVTSEILELLKQKFQDKVFKSVIRQNVKLLEAPSHSQTIFEYDSGSVGALCYMYFGKEFLLKCQS